MITHCFIPWLIFAAILVVMEYVFYHKGYRDGQHDAAKRLAEAFDDKPKDE